MMPVENARTVVSDEERPLSIFSATDRALLEEPAFATLATVGNDGAPQLTVMWCRLDGDDLLMVTPASAHKVAHLQRDPRASLVVTRPGNPYHYLELRGQIEVQRDPTTRALLVFRPERVYAHLGRADASNAPASTRTRAVDNRRH